MSLTTSLPMWMNTCHMQATTTNYSDKPRIMSSSYPYHNFLDAIFLEFEDELDNFAGGSCRWATMRHELAEKKGELVDRVELFRETHVRVETFVSQAAGDANSQPTPEGSQPLSEDEIYDQMLDRRPCYSKGLGWGPKPKARKIMSASSSTTSCSSSTQKEIELQSKLNEALKHIEVKDRNHAALASQVERMQKLIEDLTQAQ
ncbi:CACTA en-spm transposon protein [Cucumis melo var. makuwa]|uniref:CACTA en-spm transposon protein n=1 Tax=Cucumis melo var. makuwa TaxID=1194695 RepID=A0A5D3BTK2_CUCMM|nr:CACTA en-spm transposon protein [Cucumis melo var. makuwa]